MKLVIFAGGRGSVNLQNGINAVYGDTVDTTVVICAMDNGLSTGQCRQIYQGQLLGPSDLRKNQMLKHKFTNPKSTKLYDFLNVRFDADNHQAEKVFAEFLDNYKDEIAPGTVKLFEDAAENFFAQPMSRVITYDDFSISNLIYAGIAGLNGNSLSAAGKIMAKHLGISEDSVLIASDTPAYINAVTSSGVVLSDEVDIDEWDNRDDRITDLYFTDPHGKKITPPGINADTHNAIMGAEVVIFSAGTQWTSLIPTYMMLGVKDALRLSKASKYLIMNNENDLDTVGYSASDIQNLLNRWLPMQSITTIFNTNAATLMCEIERDVTFEKYINVELSEKRERSHRGVSLISTIMKDYFSEYIDNIHGLMLDYDDTIVGRNNTYAKESEMNKRLLVRASLKFRSFLTIITGNSIRSIEPFADNLTVYADCGLNEYVASRKLSDNYEPSLRFVKKGSVADDQLLSNEEVELVKTIIADCGIDMSKVTNKANASIAIKPIIPEYREAITQLLQIMCVENGFDGMIMPAGKTTIEISKFGNKTFAVNKHLNYCDSDFNNISATLPVKVIYIGDEGFEGNDKCIMEIAEKFDNRLKFLPVNNPRDTLIYLATLLETTINGLAIASITF